jgi:hypothetical protein
MAAAERRMEDQEAVTPVTSVSPTVLVPTVSCGVPVLEKATALTVPDWATPPESVQETVRPSMLVAVACIWVWWLLVEVAFSAVICSMDASWAVWDTIWVLSIGELGSWFASCVTSSFRNSWLLYSWFAVGVVLVPPE